MAPAHNFVLAGCQLYILGSAISVSKAALQLVLLVASDSVALRNSEHSQSEEVAKTYQLRLKIRATHCTASLLQPNFGKFMHCQ